MEVGEPTNYANRIEFVTISSTGNATVDFGDVNKCCQKCIMDLNQLVRLMIGGLRWR